MDIAESSDTYSALPHASKYVGKAKKLIHHRMLVEIKNGHFFIGTFYCTDKQGNIILQDAVEYRITRRSSPSPMEHRVVGLILICQVDCSIEDQLSFMSLKDQR